MDAHVHFVPKALTEVHIGGAKHSNGLGHAPKLTNSLSNVHLGAMGHGSSNSLATTPASSGQVSPRSEAAETLSERIKLTNARRIIVKVGRHVVSRNCDGRLALGRIGNLIEQLEGLVRSGREIILVTSGAVCSGVQRVRREQILNSTPLQLQSLNDDSVESGADPTGSEMRAAAASGQSGLMSLYDLLFSHMDLSCSQLLVTRNDFLGEDFKKGIRQTVDRLLGMKIIPVFNWNDAIDFNRNPKNETNGNFGGYSAGRYWDNDTLSLLLAQALKVDLLMILTDVDGVYDHMPLDDNDSSPQLIHTFCPEIHAPMVQYRNDGGGERGDGGDAFRHQGRALHAQAPPHGAQPPQPGISPAWAESNGDTSEQPHGHRRNGSQSRLAPVDAPKPPLPH
eukprot:CAMPEP_0177760400 /NCGR_PEP_ID=MMETSP0491_2-20121128/5248_1 /TAXON_ID=63592 /ORGANISM="Tetraselmis chuii, Strain PLY429" /LENGTH=394 /DNA_ID=CAMNT_0019276299 /DNA_START=183 /DNA_END=1368 /DNA_ORIENTATION=+